jgi:hypothetical protein
MKVLILAAAAVLTLSGSAAYAGGSAGCGRGGGHAVAGGGEAGGNIPSNIYGSQAFRDHSHDPEVHFLGKNTTFGRLFGHSSGDPMPATSSRQGG